MFTILICLHQGLQFVDGAREILADLNIFVIDESQLTFEDVRDDFISKMSTVTRSQVFERYFNTKPFIASVQGQTS